MAEPNQNPFPNMGGKNQPIAQALVEYITKPGEDNTTQEAIFHHQASLLAVVGAIGQLELRLAELEQKAN